MHILYDDQCKFCTKISQWALAQNRDFTAVSMRSPEAKAMLKHHGIQFIDLQTVYFVNNKVSVRSAAVFNILRHIKTPWRWLSIFRFLPSKLTDFIYKWVAKNRYRWN